MLLLPLSPGAPRRPPFSVSPHGHDRHASGRPPFPGSGNLYLGHRKLAALEIGFAAFFWFGVLLPDPEYPLMLGSFLVTAAFRRDHRRYEGVRPVNIWLLRVLFLLVFLFVGQDAWSTLVGHTGPWDHVRAAAWTMWASYALLSLVGVFHPLRMLPLVAFEILYKLIWLQIVAYPLWRAGELSGHPAEPMTGAFLWVLLPIVAMPWKYAFYRYVLNRELPSKGQAADIPEAPEAPAAAGAGSRLG